MRRTSTLLVLGILAVVLIVGHTAYVFWQKSSAEVEIEKVNHNLAEYKNRMLKYEGDRVLQAVAAKQTLDSLKAGSVQWSGIIRDIRNTMPKDEKGVDLVDILSYSGSSGSDIALTLKTVPGSENPFLDVAKVIASFDRSINFTGTFVPSVGIGEDKNGGAVLNFSLSTKYLKTDVSRVFETETKAGAEVGAGVGADSDSDSGSVPRPTAR